jgi:hypothetical protein
VIIARFSIRYAEMITRISADRRATLSPRHPGAVTRRGDGGSVGGSTRAKSQAHDAVTTADSKVLVTRTVLGIIFDRLSTAAHAEFGEPNRSVLSASTGNSTKSPMTPPAFR